MSDRELWEVQCGFKVGETVLYYSLMRPREKLLGEAKIRGIGPMYPDGDIMLWLEGVRGAIHPEACEKKIWPTKST